MIVADVYLAEPLIGNPVTTRSNGAEAELPDDPHSPPAPDLGKCQGRLTLCATCDPEL
jgi:hypothetical protein